MMAAGITFHRSFELLEASTAKGHWVHHLHSGVQKLGFDLRGSAELTPHG